MHSPIFFTKIRNFFNSFCNHKITQIFTRKNTKIERAADKMKTAVLITLFLVLLLVCYGLKIGDRTDEVVADRAELTEIVELRDNFSEGTLDSELWQITREGDFKESTIDVYDADPTKNVDFRLRLRMSTIGTRDDTVKFHGVRSVEKMNFSDVKAISFDIDWNNQSNGCYLTASIYLCPTATTGNPKEENDWLKFEYVGVPPGRNARCVVATKIEGKVKYLYTEGWPEQRSGRHIAYQRVKIILDNKSLKIIENEKEIYCSPSHGLEFSSAYLYLQMSSHSNYPAREIYFDNVVIASK